MKDENILIINELKEPLKSFYLFNYEEILNISNPYVRNKSLLRLRTEIKNAIRRIDKDTLKDSCFKCNSTNNLEVHHLKYYGKNRTKTLCSSCHKLEHK